MLAITRRVGQTIHLKKGDIVINVHIIEKKGSGNIVLGIEAPSDFLVSRESFQLDDRDYNTEKQTTKERLSKDERRVLKNIGNGSLVKGIKKVLNEHIKRLVR